MAMSKPLEIVECMEILGGRDSSFRRADLKHIGRDWVPTRPQEREALLWLLSAEHREDIKAWYRPLSGLNPFAEEFRKYLERCVGEPLPLKDFASA